MNTAPYQIILRHDMKILSKEYSPFRKAWVIWYEYAGLPASATFRTQARADAWLQRHTAAKDQPNATPDGQPKTLIQDTIYAVCAKHKVTKEKLLSRFRYRNLVAARKEVSEILEEAGYTYSDIGRALNKDHTSVLHYLGRTSKATVRAKKAQTP